MEDKIFLRDDIIADITFRTFYRRSEDREKIVTIIVENRNTGETISIPIEFCYDIGNLLESMGVESYIRELEKLKRTE